MIEYFYNTNIVSTITDRVAEKFDRYLWDSGPTSGQWQPKFFDQSLIQLDPFLSSFHSKLQGRLNLFKFYPCTCYQWHVDGLNSFNFNLVFKEHKNSFVVFEKLTQDTSVVHKYSKEVVELKYVPLTWHVFNAQIPHTIFNLDNEIRYLLTYMVRKTSSISYEDFISSYNWQAH